MEVVRSQASIEGLFTSEREQGNSSLCFGETATMQLTTAGSSVDVLGQESHDERSLNDRSEHGNSALNRLDATSIEHTAVPNEARSSGFGGAGGRVDIAAQRKLLGGRPKQRRVCHICGRECPSKHKLKRHLSTHSEDRPYNCRVCGRSFKWSEYLSKHMRQQHSVQYLSETVSEGNGHVCQAIHTADQTSNIDNDDFDSNMDAPVDQAIDIAAAEDTIPERDAGFVSPDDTREESSILLASQHQMMTSPEQCLQHHQLQQHQYHHHHHHHQQEHHQLQQHHQQEHHHLQQQQEHHQLQQLQQEQHQLQQHQLQQEQHQLQQHQLQQEQHQLQQQQLQQEQHHLQQQQLQQEQHQLQQQQQQQHLCQLQQQQHFQQQQSTAVDLIQQLGISLPNNSNMPHLSHINFSPSSLASSSCSEKSFSFPPEQIYTPAVSNYPGTMVITFPVDLGTSMQSAATLVNSMTSTYGERSLFSYGTNLCISHPYSMCEEPRQVVATKAETSREPFVAEGAQKVSKHEVASIGIQCEVGPETLAALREEEARMFPLVSEDFADSGVEGTLEDQSVLLNDGCSYEEGNSADLLSPVYSQGSEKFIQKFPCEHQDCGKAYVHRKDLIRHMRIRHGLAPKNLTPIPVEAPAKPHICQVATCGRSYFHMKDLRRHQRQCHAAPLVPMEAEGLPSVVVGGGPMCKGMLRYPCDFVSCSRSYVHKKDLIRHKRIFHKDSTPIPTIPPPIHYTDAELKKIRHELKLEGEGEMGCHCQRLDSTGSMISGGEDMGEEIAESDLATLSAANIMQSLSSSASMVGMYDTGHSEAMTLVSSAAQSVSGPNPTQQQQVTCSPPQNGHMTTGMLIEAPDLDSYSSGITLSNSVAIVHPTVYSYPYISSTPVAAYTYVDTQAGLQQQDAAGQFDDATTAAVLSALASTGNVSQLQSMMNQLLQ